MFFSCVKLIKLGLRYDSLLWIWSYSVNKLIGIISTVHRLQWSQGPVAQVMFHRRERKKENSSTAQVGTESQWKVSSMLYSKFCSSKREEKKSLWWSMWFSSNYSSWRKLQDSCSCDGVREMNSVLSSKAIITPCSPPLQPEELRDIVKHFHMFALPGSPWIQQSTSEWGQAEGTVISDKSSGSWFPWISQRFPWCHLLFALVHSIVYLQCSILVWTIYAFQNV